MDDAPASSRDASEPPRRRGPVAPLDAVGLLLVTSGLVTLYWTSLGVPAAASFALFAAGGVLLVVRRIRDGRSRP